MIIEQPDWRERSLVAEAQNLKHLQDIGRLAALLEKAYRRMALLEQGLGAEMARAHEAEDRLARRGLQP